MPAIARGHIENCWGFHGGIDNGRHSSRGFRPGLSPRVPVHPRRHGLEALQGDPDAPAVLVCRGVDPRIGGEVLGAVRSYRARAWLEVPLHVPQRVHEPAEPLRAGLLRLLLPPRTQDGRGAHDPPGARGLDEPLGGPGAGGTRGESLRATSDTSVIEGVSHGAPWVDDSAHGLKAGSGEDFGTVAIRTTHRALQREGNGCSNRPANTHHAQP